MRNDQRKIEIEKLEREVEELRRLSIPENPSAELERLRGEVGNLRRDFYEHLGPWQRTLLSRHPQRPYLQDYIRLLLKTFTNCMATAPTATIWH